MKVQKLKLLNQKVLAGIIASFALFFQLLVLILAVVVYFINQISLN